MLALPCLTCVTCSPLLLALPYPIDAYVNNRGQRVFLHFPTKYYKITGREGQIALILVVFSSIEK